MRREVRLWERPRIRRAGLYLAAFALPVGILLAVYAAVGIAPFGDKNLLVTDMDGQYVCFFSYYKDMWKEGNDFFYTFSKNLGGDMLGFSAYYLFSPFNLVLLPFSTANLPTGILLLTLLKVGSAGLTCSLFLTKERGARGALLFSMAYALTTYMFAHQQNTLWLDGLITLPLVLLGIHRLVTRRRCLLYIVSLGATLFINYYIGYMICIFSVLYFLFQLAARHPRSPLSTWRQRGRALLRFGVSSLLAAGLAGASLLPTLISLPGGDKSLGAIAQLNGNLRYDSGDFLSKMFTGMYETADMWGSTLPMVFCGIFAVLLLTLYFFNRRIRPQEKLAAAIWLSVQFAGFQIQALYLTWHAFNYPVGFPSRQAFLFCMTVLYLGHRCFTRLRGGVRLRHLGYALAIFMTVAAVVARQEYVYADIRAIWGDVLLFGALCLPLAGLIRLPKRMRRRGAAALLAVLVGLNGVNLFVNGRDVLSKMEYRDKEEFPAYIGEVQPVVDRLKARDKSFYRMEQLFHRGRNDPMLFSYRGLSHFSSTEKAATKDFLGKLGFRNNGNWANYWEGSTMAVDSLLGVKYRLARAATDPAYEPLFTKGPITAYQNPCALPLGFAVTDEVGEALDGDDPFRRLDRLYTAMTGRETTLYRPAPGVTRTLWNMTSSTAGAADIYIREEKDAKAYVEYTFTCDREQPLYAYFTAGALKKADIAVNGVKLGEYFSMWRYGVVYLGRFQPGEEVTVRLTPRGDTLLYRDALFYYEDVEALAAAVETLRAQPYAIESYTSSHFTGSVTADERRDRLLLTIPADNGWTVRVDGRAVPVEKAFGALVSVPLPPGTHTVELRYIPPGFLAGACATGAVVLLLAAAGWWKRKRKRNIHVRLLNLQKPS